MSSVAFNSYLNRLFLYSEDADKAAAISTLDYSRMSWETQALICAIINHYGKASELKTGIPIWSLLLASRLWSDPCFSMRGR